MAAEVPRNIVADDLVVHSLTARRSNRFPLGRCHGDGNQSLPAVIAYLHAYQWIIFCLRLPFLIVRRSSGEPQSSHVMSL